MPLAIFSETFEHQGISSFGQEFWPIANDTEAIFGITQTQLPTFLDKPFRYINAGCFLRISHFRRKFENILSFRSWEKI